MITDYLDSLKNAIDKKITTVITDQTIEDLVGKDLYYHIDPKNSSKKFQEYYFKVTENRENFLHDSDFFKHFKYQYSLQGVDNNLLIKLESNKQKILDYFDSDRSFNVYDEFFSKVKTKHGETFILKDFGSFFAKLAHTQKPETFCALDNPIKNYFGLEKESFLVSFYLISQAYKDFCTNNRTAISGLKNLFYKIDHDAVMIHDKLTDLKLLDLIFWYQANILTRGIR
jgi:hypothetical protein